MTYRDNARKGEASALAAMLEDPPMNYKVEMVQV